MILQRCALLVASIAAAAWAQERTVTVQVPANQAWTNAGIYVNPGSSVLLQASGFIEAVPPSDNRAMFHHVPPSGRPMRQENKPHPDMPTLVMLARLGNGPVLEAGAQKQIEANEQNGSGELQLGINDDYVADNTGTWTVRVTLQQNTTFSQRQDYQSNRGFSDRGYRADRGYQAERGYASDTSSGAVAAIDRKAQQLGRNRLGSALADIRTARDGTGRYREYDNGVIYWSPETGAHAVMGPIRDEWMNRGADSGELGYPVSDEYTAPDGMSRMVRFQWGSITWNDRDGVQVRRTP
jgi:hypothetical protein